MPDRTILPPLRRSAADAERFAQAEDFVRRALSEAGSEGVDETAIHAAAVKVLRAMPPYERKRPALEMLRAAVERGAGR